MKTSKYVAVIEVDLESSKYSSARSEAKNLAVIPKDCLDKVLSFIEGRDTLAPNESFSTLISDIRQYMKD